MTTFVPSGSQHGFCLTGCGKLAVDKMSHGGRPGVPGRCIGCDGGGRCLTLAAAVGATNVDGYTALMLAVADGHNECASVLIERGAVVDKTKENGWTALMIAATDGHCLCVVASRPGALTIVTNSTHPPLHIPAKIARVPGGSQARRFAWSGRSVHRLGGKASLLPNGSSAIDPSC